MTTLLKSAAAIALAAGFAMAGTTGALAKAHDQGQTADPGANVGEETAGPAQGLGGVVGNGKGPGSTPAGGGPGSSGSAGRDG